MKLDIQTVLTVIGRRKNFFKNKESSHLNLQTTCFQATHLMNAHLEGADLRNTHFEGANHINTHLEETDLMDAHFEESHLSRTHFEGAFLGYAHLEKSYLEGVDLSNASLKEVKNLIINQLYDVKTLYKAELDESLRSLLIEKYPTIFDEP
jgi:uncharacterized protein YjbI with pentapeptide repeats